MWWWGASLWPNIGAFHLGGAGGGGIGGTGGTGGIGGTVSDGGGDFVRSDREFSFERGQLIPIIMCQVPCVLSIYC